MKSNPTRLAAFANLALKEPAKAVRELDRCIHDLGFKGVLPNGTTDGKFLDNLSLFPILEATEALHLPLYIHPAPPPQTVFNAYYAGLLGEAGYLLSIAGWG